MGQMIFLYDFEFVPFTNPPRTKERFEQDLRDFFKARDLDYGMSALGGMVSTRGSVHSTRRPVTEEDRQALAGWAGSQRVRCTARLGAVEEDHEDLQLFREVTEWVFPVDNLSADDRAEAAAYHRWIQNIGKPEDGKRD